jgi:primosomal protein N'
VQKKKNIQTSIRSWLKRIAIPRSVKMNIDVDPQNFY